MTIDLPSLSGNRRVPREMDLYAGTPEVTVAGTAGPARVLHFLRTPGDGADPARILTARTVTDVASRTG